MSRQMALAVLATGLVTAVGQSAAAACAAMRGKLTNPVQSQFLDSAGQWITVHHVQLARPWTGLNKLMAMAQLAGDEALAGLDADRRRGVPLLLCLAEEDRPGRLPGLDADLVKRIAEALGLGKHPASAVLPLGRVGVAAALARARALIEDEACPQVLILATDSLLHGPTLQHYERRQRLLTGHNSNGFSAGEAAGALLVGRPTGAEELLCTGLGFGLERATVASEAPLRADGLTQAMRGALAEAQQALHEVDFRISDASGEHYYFKEASLALSRMLKQRREEFDLWHPAECTGEIGAGIGAVAIALAEAACRKRYTRGSSILVHLGNDQGARAALTLRFGASRHVQ